jgi:hypothetical protein
LGEVGPLEQRVILPSGQAAGLRSSERMLVQGQALRGDQGLGGCAWWRSESGVKGTGAFPISW